MRKWRGNMPACFVRLVLLAGICRADASFGWTGLPEQPNWVGGGYTNVDGLAAGDLNGDGLPDVLVTGSDSAGLGVFVFFQNANGKFSDAPDRRLALEKRAKYPLTGDFDCDGKPDFAVVMSRELRLFRGRDDFSMPLKYFSVNQNGYSGPLLFGALRKNTRDFLVGPVFYSYDGKTGVRTGYFSGPSVNDNTLAAWGDFDNDGMRDMVFSGGGGLRIYYGPFTGFNVVPCELSQFVELPDPASPGMPRICDLNGDERLDIIVNGAKMVDTEGKKRQRGLFIYYQNSPQGFNEITTASHVICSDAHVWDVADLNCDGCSDIILSGGTVLSVLLRKKKTAWPVDDKSPDLRINLPGRAMLLASADINGDKQADILAAGLNYVVLFINQTIIVPKEMTMPKRVGDKNAD